MVTKRWLVSLSMVTLDKVQHVVFLYPPIPPYLLFLLPIYSDDGQPQTTDFSYRRSKDISGGRGPYRTNGIGWQALKSFFSFSPVDLLFAANEALFRVAVQARMRVCCCGVPFFSLSSGLRERKNLSQLDSRKTLDGPSPRADDEHHAVDIQNCSVYRRLVDVMRIFFRSHRLSHVLPGAFPTTSLPASSTLFYNGDRFDIGERIRVDEQRGEWFKLLYDFYFGYFSFGLSPYSAFDA